jgi:hypothetical protein
MCKALPSCTARRAPRPRAALLALLAALPLHHASLFAQQSAGALSGIVRATDGTALAGAQIVVPGVRDGVLSAADGRYQVSGVRPGDLVVEVRLLGYHTASRTLTFAADQPTEWDVTLDLEPIAVDPVEATGARARTPQLEGFYARRDRGTGTYFTRGEIEKMNVREMTDILRRVPGARVVAIQGPFGATNVLQLVRSQETSIRPCPISYYINGVPFPVRYEIGIDAYVRAQDVEAVEVYTGTSRVPPEFTSAGQTSRCGVVAVWTRVGEGTTRARG